MPAGMSTPERTSRPRKAIHLATLFVLLSAGLSAGCDRVDAAALPEWSPADHTNQGNPTPNQVDTSKPRPGMPDLAKEGITDVVLATWKQSCTPCHGTIGRGDGPQARGLNPPDFTNPQWQKNAIDSEIAYALKKGRGQMPAFAHLPDDTVQGLIHLIRRLNSDRSAAGPAPTSSSATAPSQPPAPSPTAAPKPKPARKSVKAGAAPPSPPPVSSWTFWRARLARALIIGALGIAATQILPALPRDQNVEVQLREGQLREVRITYLEDSNALAGAIVRPELSGTRARHTARLQDGAYRISVDAFGEDASGQSRTWHQEKAITLSGERVVIRLD